MLVFAIISITLAFFFYTASVWIVQFSKTVSQLHLFLFITGIFFDVTGTLMMSTLVQNRIEFNLHSIIGILGILLMLAQTSWCFYIFKKGKALKSFKVFGLIVWLIWLIPYFTGVFLHKG